MVSAGISRRLRRLEGPGGRFFFFALDHGLPAGPLRGIEDPRAALGRLRGAPITGVLVNPGIARLLPADPAIPLIVHLSAGTVLGSAATSKVLASLPGRAVALGADAVSVQVHFGDVEEARMMSDVGRVVDEAREFGLPTLVMAYPPAVDAGEVGAACHAARAAAEMGAQIVQTPYTGSVETFREVVRGCPAPLVATGGGRAPSPQAFLDQVRETHLAGAAGVSVGRNLFGDPDPRRMAEAIGGILFGASPPRAVEVAAR